MSVRKSFPQTITGITLILIIIGTVSKGIGFFREIVFASFFGVSANYELYLIAAVLPITINTIIIFLTQNIYIPVYLKIKHTDSSKAKSFLLQNIILFLGSSLILAIVLLCFSDNFIRFYVRSSEISLLSITKIIFKIFLLTIPLTAIISVISAHLYAEKKFILPTISQLFLNVTVIILIFLFTNEYGVYTIPFGYVVGTFLQLIFLLFYIRNEFTSSSLSKPSLSDFKFVISSIVITIFIEAISQIHILADRFFITQVESGGIAGLNYAMTLYILPISIITISLSTAIFPAITESILREELKELSIQLDKSLQFIFILFIPISFIYFQYGEVIIKLILQRGNFNQSNTIMTAKILSIYSLSITFYSIYSILYKLIYSASLIKQLLWIIIIAAVIKICLNFVLIKDYHQNGLALSSTITYIFLYLSTAVLLDKKIKLKILLTSLKNFMFYAINILLSYLFVRVLLEFFNFYILRETIEIILLITIFIINIMITDRSLFLELITSFRISNMVNK